MALVFDGFDLTVYGTVLSTLLDAPSQIGRVDAATAGALGSCALIGASPILFLLPHPWFRLPESPRWLLSRGPTEEARAVAARTGVPLLEEIAVQESGAGPAKRGFAAAFSRQFFLATVLPGFMSFSGLLLTYGSTPGCPASWRATASARSTRWRSC